MTSKMRVSQMSRFIIGFLFCQIAHGLPALTLPATITVNAAGGGGSSPNLDTLSTSIGSAAQQLLGGEISSQSGQLNAGGLGGSLNVEGLQGLSGLTSGGVSGLASNGLGLTSGGLRSFSLTSGNGAGGTSSFTTSASNGGNLDASSTASSSSSDAENISQGTGIRAGIQQFPPMGQMVGNFVSRTQLQNDGASFDSNGQRVLSFGSRPEGISSATTNAVPQGSWVIDVSSYGDATNAPNNFLSNRLTGFSDQPTPATPVMSTFVQGAQSPIAATWSARQQAPIQSPINPNYLQQYVVQPRPPAVYYTVADAQNQVVAPARSLGYPVRNSDGLQLQYARNGGVYSGPVTGSGQAYFSTGQVVPAQQFQLAF